MNNKSIQILRTNLDNTHDRVKDEVLLDGQPFYNKTSNKLYIGDGSTKISNLKYVGQEANQSLQTQINAEISRSTNFDNSHNNIENGGGQGSLKQLTKSSSGISYNNEASGSGAVAFGKDTKSKGNTSFVIGQKNTATENAKGSFLGGYDNIADNEYTFTFGQGLKNTTRDKKACFGQWNEDEYETLFEVGCGTSDADEDRRNAFEVRDNGIVIMKDRAKVYGAPQDPTDVVRKQDLEKSQDEFNLKNGAGVKAIQQKQDAGYTGIAIKTKNPNAYALDNTLTDNEPIGAVGDYASSFGGASSAQGKRSLAEGTNTIAKGRYSHAEGCNSVTLGDDSHAEGGLTVAGAIAAHSEGWETQAVEEYSHAEGYRTIAAGSGSHAEGGMTYANAKYSHTEGVGNKSATVLPEQGGGGGGTEPPPTESESPDELLGAYAHVEGISNTVYGYGSHAEGQGNIVYGHRSHAEGRNTIAGRIDSYADGSRKVAGECIHTEGFNTVASGNYSHAEGANTKAIGEYSHAAGGNTEAHRAYSTAIGFYTTTEGGANCSFVTGKYNIKNYSNALFAVGNGESDNDRKNAFTVLTDGRAKVQTAPSEIDDVVNKGYVDGSGMQGTGDPPLQGYNKSKGTIEERLTNLGFKQLSTSVKRDIVVSGANSGNIGSINLQTVNTNRQGNRANIQIDVSFRQYSMGTNKSSPFYEFYFNSAEATVTGLIPEEYRPTFNYVFTIYGKTYLHFRSTSNEEYVTITDTIPIKCTVTTSGDVTLQVYSPLSLVFPNSTIDDHYTQRAVTGFGNIYRFGYSVNPLNS